MTDERLREAARAKAERICEEMATSLADGEDFYDLLAQKICDALGGGVEPAPRESDEARARAFITAVLSYFDAADDEEAEANLRLDLLRDYAAARREGAEAIRERALAACEAVADGLFTGGPDDYASDAATECAEAVRALEVNDGS